MIDKKQSRIRRAQATRLRIGLQRMHRLAVHRTNLNIYACVLSADGGRVLVSASTLEQEVRNQLTGAKGRGGNAQAAKVVGTRLAQKAVAAGIDRVAFDRSGFRYHGRVRALADAAREAGLKI
jgi:large subunit ribosomal protein L18